MKMKSWMPLLMIGVMILFMIGLMLLFGYLVGGPTILPMLYFMTGANGAGMGRLMLVALLGLVGMGGMMYLMFRWMSGRHGPMARMMGSGESSLSGVDSKNLDTLVFNLPDVSCDHCKMKVEAELGKLPGVDSVEVDLESQTAEIRVVTPPTRSEIEGVLREIGYPAS